jgi:hypothetical protein
MHALLRGVSLLASCVVAAGLSRVAPGRHPCLPPDSTAVALQGLTPERLAGHYELTLVSTWPARSEDTVATGSLDLWIDSVPPPPLPDSAEPRSPSIVPPYPRPSLIGATDAPVWRLGALSRIRPDSRDPVGPGFRLIDTLLVIGACPDRVACEERHSTDLVITSLSPYEVRGRWALRPSAYPPPGVDSAGYPRGYFCAARRARNPSTPGEPRSP